MNSEEVMQVKNEIASFYADVIIKYSDVLIKMAEEAEVEKTEDDRPRAA